VKSRFFGWPIIEPDRARSINLMKLMRYLLKYLLTLFSCLILQFVNAQYLQKIDSLELSLEFATNPKEKTGILLNLSNEYKNNDPEKALAFARKALHFTEESGNTDDQLKAMLKLSEIYCSLSDFKAAMEYARKSKDLAGELDNRSELAEALQLIGLVYSDLADFDESSDYYYQSLKIYEQLGDLKGTEKALSRIASVYFDQKNYDKALEYYFRSMNMAKESGNREGIAAGLNDIAAVYGNRKQYEKVVKYLEEAVIINQELGNRRAEAINYTNLGVINQRLQNYDEALPYFEKALQLFNDLNHTVMIANYQVVLSGYYLEIDKPDKSIEYAKTAYDSSVEHGFKKVVYDAAAMLSKAYLQKIDTLTSNKYLILQYQMKDSLDIERSAMQLSKLEIRYAFEKQKQAKQIEQQRKEFVLIIIILTLVLGLGIVIMYFARQKIKAKNTKIEKMQLEKELEFKNKELALKVMSLLKKNEILSEISKKLMDVKNEAVKEETKEAITRIYKDLQKSTDDEIWEEFELRFRQVHRDFYDQLMEKFPDLSPSEQRLCAFLRLNMSSKEISELTGQSLNALETARYRLRKKLGISNSQVNLITFLSQV
jgi:tetratricopeptide (TPR) repeat protein